MATTKGQQHTLLQKIKNLYHLLIAVWSAWRAGFPGRKLTLIGVTGTDGKTTTTTMIYHILKQNGVKVALINTIEAIVGNEIIATGLHVTSQDPRDLQPLLKKILEQGYEAVVLEVTSHALDQHRVWGNEFDIAVVSNIKEDHLDYHGDYQHYLEAKGRLFDGLTSGRKHKGKAAVLNAADSSYDYLFRKPAPQRYMYNSEQTKDEQAHHMYVSGQEQTLSGISFSLHCQGQEYPVSMPLLGLYNADNAQAAIAASLAYGLEIKGVIKALASLPQVKGRMQRVDLGTDYSVIVDFAHTPAALEHALHDLRQLNPERLIVLFGCAGQRDKGRRKMGAVAARLADITIITNEDNRDEDIHKISAEIAEHARAAGAREFVPKQAGQIDGYPVYIIVPDRQQAINFALQIARSGDIIDLTGKGHEQSLNIDGQELPWDEFSAVQTAYSSGRDQPGS